MFWSYLHYKSIFFIQVYATVLFWKDGFGTIVHSINLILGVCPIFLRQKGVSCTLDTNFQFRSGNTPKICEDVGSCRSELCFSLPLNSHPAVSQLGSHPTPGISSHSLLFF